VPDALKHLHRWRITQMTRLRPFYGWRVVAAAFVMAIFAWGLGFYGPSIYVNELVRTRGWPVSIVSGAVTFHFLFSACLILRLADVHERYGLVAVTRGGVVAFGLGAIGWSHASAPWQLYVAACLTGLGWSAMSGAAINAFVAPWFDKKRGIALSHAFNGASMGGVLFTPLWAYMIATYGFETATLVVAVGGLVVLWPLAGRYFAWRPEHFGLAPDGGAAIDRPLARGPIGRCWRTGGFCRCRLRLPSASLRRWG
jgi:MFS family permease